ncbi:MAG TPA: response regulator transcription factor [Fimbriimonadaceae bacterium]|nr:response regulator transcription factor [Fimbriimonadaceae bacterium]
MAIRIVIVDDHEIVREGLRALFLGQRDFEIVGEAGNGEEAEAVCRKHRPDVVLLDLRMPKVGGAEGIARIKAVSPSTNILVLTSYLDPGIVKEMLRAGALGFMLKDVSRNELLDAIRSTADGKPVLHADAQAQLVNEVSGKQEYSPIDDLTSRELDILRLIASGRSNKEIAGDLTLTEGTVKGYVSNVLAKLGVQDRTQAALLAVREGLIKA